MGLNRRLQKRKARSICFTPGLIPCAGLFRHQKKWKETMLKKEAVEMSDTEEWGGCMLAWMLLSETAPIHDNEKSGTYWRSPFGISKRGGKIPRDLFLSPVNEEAANEENQDTLWRLSAELLSLKLGFLIE